MRLLFINRYFHPDLSATSQLLTELAEDLGARGHTVTVITGKTSYLDGEAPRPARETYKGIRIVRVGFTGFGRSRLVGRLVDYLSFSISAFWTALRLRDQDCLVVLSDPPLLSVLAALVRLGKPVKTVCWLQDVFPEIAIRAGVLKNRLAGLFLRRIATWSLRQMDQVVVIGRCMERHLLAQGLSAESIITIPNWADGTGIAPFTKEGNDFLRQHRLEDKFLVMYSGNHGLVHEFETLVGLIRETRTVADLCFCFVGAGIWKSRLINIAVADDWQHVVFLPYQPKSLLHSSLSAADVHLVTLRAEMEGLSVPSKIYGVLAAARPIIFIGPPGSEAAAIVQEAECGFNVQPGDTPGAIKALLALYHDPALLGRQGTAARRYFDARFDRSNAAERFHQVLHRICVQLVPGRGRLPVISGQ